MIGALYLHSMAEYISASEATSRRIMVHVSVVPSLTEKEDARCSAEELTPSWVKPHAACSQNWMGPIIVQWTS